MKHNERTKLIIDIDEKIYEHSCENSYDNNDIFDVFDAIAYGIPLEKLKEEIENLEIDYIGNVTMVRRIETLRILDKYFNAKDVLMLKGE